MTTRRDTAVALTRLHGTDFRLQELNCPHCCWQGRAGMLVVPGSAGLADTVRYSCPRCRQIIAEHPGLSADEVKEELRSLRQLLREESRRTREISYKASREQGGPDFRSVRDQISGLDVA